MEIIRFGKSTIILDRDEETCGQFEEVIFAGAKGVLSVDAILKAGKAKPQQPVAGTEPGVEQTPGAQEDQP
jgi:hypothetical protein